MSRARSSRALTFLLACCTVGSAFAQSASDEGRVWLHRIYEATHSLSYTGTFVYQHDRRSETSRVTRRSSAQGDVERLEVLDGEPREIVRSKEGVRCYLPQARTLKVDRHGVSRRFPTMLPEQVTELLKHYTVQVGAIDRVAGRSCQTVALQPKDRFRYGYELCADVSTGMLLRSITLNETNAPVEQFTFTQLEVGDVRPEAVEPQHTTRTWRIEEASVRPADLAAEGWRVDADLPGFEKIVEVVRVLREREPVGQLVYSDGLAAVSVFIEPARGRHDATRRGAAAVGGINIFVREVDDHIVTVVGEAPAASGRRIADRVRYEPPK
ncbi:MAG: MucB/RseB C-terminal domain-containing protein [Burkholderiales bacterium]|nr:MucB/RseB C-terminal domain-containing protein [Burkholderiales bacterium]